VLKTTEKEVIVDDHNTGYFAFQKTVQVVQQTYLEQKVQQIVNNFVKSIIFNKKVGKTFVSHGFY